MKKNIILLLIVFAVGSCCSKKEDCKCPPLVLNFMFDCFTEKELTEFKIIKYDSATGALVSSENINFIRVSGNAQYNINLETDTKYDIEIVNRPLGIYRRFSNFKFSIEDDPKRCFDCKTKIRYKTCRRVSYINYFVNGQPIERETDLRSDDPTQFKSINIKNCPYGYANKAITY